MLGRCGWGARTGAFFFLMIRRPPRSTLDRSSAASDVYKRQRPSGSARSGVVEDALAPSLGRLRAFEAQPVHAALHDVPRQIEHLLRPLGIDALEQHAGR